MIPSNSAMRGTTRAVRAGSGDARQRGQVENPLDERLLAALAHRLPDCAGVALRPSTGSYGCPPSALARGGDGISFGPGLRNTDADRNWRIRGSLAAGRPGFSPASGSPGPTRRIPPRSFTGPLPGLIGQASISCAAANSWSGAHSRVALPAFPHRGRLVRLRSVQPGSARPSRARLPSLSPGHIACTRQSNSEIVVPLLADERLIACSMSTVITLDRFNGGGRNTARVTREKIVAACDWSLAGNRRVLTSKGTVTFKGDSHH